LFLWCCAALSPAIAGFLLRIAWQKAPTMQLRFALSLYSLFAFKAKQQSREDEKQRRL